MISPTSHARVAVHEANVDALLNQKVAAVGRASCCPFTYLGEGSNMAWRVRPQA